jgi:hypothetical protein
MEGLYSEPETNLYLRGLLVCHNLIRLELRFYCFHNLDNVVEVLQNCPKLQFFSIKKVFVFEDCFGSFIFFLCFINLTYFGI